MIGHLLNRTLVVHRPSVSTDAVGGQSVAYTQVGSVRAAVSQPSADERREAAAEGAVLTHMVHLASSSDVRRGDELDGDIPALGPGVRLRVVSVVANSRNSYRRAACEVRQTEAT